jgi:hypothetical protein
MSMTGYKYICWDLGDDNAEFYMSRIEAGCPIHHLDLTITRGLNDQEDMPGIYFTRSLEDLYIWVEELFEYARPSAIQLLEVTPIGEVQKRVYDNGRVAYVAPICRCRVLRDSELTPDLFRLVRTYFDQ